MTIRLCVVVGAILFTAAAAPVQAQSQSLKDNLAKTIRKIGLHANFSFRHPIDDEDVSKGFSVGPSIGLSPGETNGWKYPVTLSRYHEDLLSPGGEKFAVFRSISILAGVGYGWHHGRLSTSANAEVGYSFNHVRLVGDPLRAFSLSSGVVALDVGNSFVLRPKISTEYFLTRKFTLRASLDYVRTRPDITVVTQNGRFEDRWDISNVHANLGLGFYPFHR